MIIENYYQEWSYVKTPGFDDALKQLDQLNSFHNISIPVERSITRRNNQVQKS
jgi:hypothetical protein